MALLGLAAASIARAENDLFGLSGVQIPNFVISPAPVTDSTVLSPEQTRRVALTGRATDLVKLLHLPLEIAGYSSDMNPDEEFQLYKGRGAGMGAILLNSHLWFDKGLDETHGYLSYTLFRAAADYYYRRHFDGDRCAWVVESQEENNGGLNALVQSGASTEDWMHELKKDFSNRDEEFRASMDPEGNPDKILKGLVHYALSAVEQRAADLWALSLYRRHISPYVPYAIEKRINQRERALAWDFGRALSAMTLAERVSFRQVLKSPILYENPDPRVLAAAKAPAAPEVSDGTEATDPLLTDPDSPSN
jgi:hypothetical protein